MDIKGFQVWLSAARGLTRAQRREALAVLSGRSEGEASKAAIARLGVVRTARARGRFRAVWRGVCGATSARAAAGPSTADRYAAVGPAPQGTLAVVRGVAGEGGDGEGLGGALRRGGEHGVPLASPVSAIQVLKGIVEADETYVLESRKGAAGLDARRGGAARRRSAASRASRCRFSWRRTGAGRRSARCCPGSMRRRRGCPRPGGREGRPAGLRRRRELPTLRRRARGEPRSTQPLDGGTGSGRSACADGEQPPQ